MKIFNACVFVCFVAPTYIPRNFRVLQIIDGTTVQFAWDPPLTADEVNIRGILKAYQVVFVILFCCMLCMYMCVCVD